jgi:ribosomal protein S18 acetylase RimI-like enzyme
MRDRASGFCIYNDAALAIARARAAGMRVLYLDLDVHHGDGVQALHDADPGVMTVSIHESGRSLFPGTGFIDEVGEGTAAGTKVNLPLQPYTSAVAWLAAVEAIVPELAASFGPDIVVSQHGADSHAWDPLAHILNTTTSMGAAARLVDAVAHRWAGGRWLSTGGGGYDAYRVVPRSWSLVWLAAAHREVPARIAPEWRSRWAAEAERYGQSPLPERFEDDDPGGIIGAESQAAADRAAGEAATLVRALFVPALVRAATDLEWWRANDEVHHVRADEIVTGAAAAVDRRGGGTSAPPLAGDESPTLLRSVDAATWARLAVAPRVVVPADPADTHALVLGALRDGRGDPVVSAAVANDRVVGLAVSAVGPRAGAATAADARQLLTVGVAPAFRGRGIGTALLASHLDALAGAGLGEAPIEVRITLAERDVVAPLDRPTRAAIARRLLTGAGFIILEPDGRLDIDRRLAQADPAALVARLDRPAR